MASLIRLKRSGTTGSPTALAQGEIAYSYLSGTEINGGDRLYIGTGTETSGEAANIEVIGGKYFTDKLDHSPGTLTASSAIITDSSNKIDLLNVDNITIDGNSITSTNTNGNITLSPTGSGAVDVASSKIINLTNPTTNQDAATKKYVDDEITSLNAGSNLNISGDTGSDSVFLQNETLDFSGDTGITTSIANNNVIIDLDDTAVTPGSYGSASSIPTFTVDQQGRLTAAGTVSVATNLSLSGDSGTDTVSLLSDTLTVSGGSNLTTTITNNQISVALDNVISGLTSIEAGNLSVSGNVIESNNVDGDITLTPNGTGSVIVSSNLVVEGTTFTINSNEVNIGDAIILLNSDETGTPSQDGGIEIERGTSTNKSLVWDESTDKWTVGSETFVAGAFEGPLTGNASTATALQTSRTFSITGDIAASTVSFDGTGNVVLNATVQPNSVALGTDTTGNYVSTVGVTGGTGLSVSGSGEGASLTLAGLDATTSTKGVASFASANFSVNSGVVSILALDGGTY